MADTAVATVTQSKTAVTDAAIGLGTAIATGNTHVITPAGPLEEMEIRVANTTGTTKTVTVKAGVKPAADAMGQGDFVSAAIAATTGIVLLPPLSSSRFLQANGTVRIDVETGMTGFILPIQIPRV
jgi:multidrug efflux pump subunit AcrA (membrane-fusion protein)